MTKKQPADQNKAQAQELDEEQLDSISGGPTAVENVALNFTKTSSLSTQTTISSKLKTSP